MPWKDKEIRNAKQREKYRQNPDAFKERSRRWTEKDPEHVKHLRREQMKRAYLRNPEKFRLRRRQYYVENKEKVLEIQHTKQRCYNVKSNYGITCDDLRRMRLEQNEHCAICSRVFRTELHEPVVDLIMIT